MKILLIEPGKQPAEREISGSLQSMQRIVGGTIQAVYPFAEPVALICNDEGKLLKLPLNRALCGPDKQPYDIIAGTFFLCGAPPEADSFASLTEAQMRRYQERFASPELFLQTDSGLLIIREGTS